jgi:hypothetical protein
MAERKKLQNKDIEVLRKLLFNGLTSSEVAKEMAVSAATVNNYRAYFKKKGDTFPNNRGRKLKNPSSSITTTSSKRIFSDLYSYNINGLIITFSDRPKSLRIGKNGMVVEY